MPPRSHRIRYDLVIFDLDGTLADLFPFFVGAQNEVARRHGFSPIALEEMESLRHLAPRDVMRHVGLPGWKMPFVARSFIRLMREQVSAVPLFDGIAEALLPRGTWRRTRNRHIELGRERIPRDR